VYIRKYGDKYAFIAHSIRLPEERLAESVIRPVDKINKQIKKEEKLIYDIYIYNIYIK
jgi:hypothetical protein